ncbi:hypothetical protein CES85_2847 (plasmid) [Ochrobactrum quorumnocens]|uniref:Uncharacterized protein n=1 Tax=Ochrobactrum quorumnocens TaxID=271865 RepID=A0A248UQ28_9HYPH|nr:hypothetical protein CES85_2847 [[Ochrobactrum] quorumnocens]
MSVWSFASYCSAQIHTVFFSYDTNYPVKPKIDVFSAAGTSPTPNQLSASSTSTA